MYCPPGTFPVAELKIGLIAPSSGYLPKLGAVLASSLSHGLGSETEVVVETTKYNATPEDVGAALQRFGLDPSIEVVVAPLNTGLLAGLLPTLEAEELCLVALTAGEDLVSAADQHPLLFVNSFNLWQSAWLAGFAGVNSHGPKAAGISCLHDSGYGMTLASALGVEAASGQIVLTALTHAATADESPQPALDMMAEVEPDVAFGMYSGRESESFLNAWRAIGERAARPPLMWLPALISGTPTNLEQSEAFATAVGRWAPTADHEFHDWHQATLGRGPNAYSVLAYEAGSMIAAASAARTDNTLAELQTTLAAASCDGPRGAVSLNDNERASGFATYDVAVGPDGRLVHSNREPIEAPTLLVEQIRLASTNTAKVGWTNPYLIA